MAQPASRPKAGKQAMRERAPDPSPAFPERVKKFFTILLGPLTESPRRVLLIAGAIVIVGLAVVGVGAGEVGRYITLIGLILMIFGVHTFGRLGPDDTSGARGD
jgi:hypothetical protein